MHGRHVNGHSSRMHQGTRSSNLRSRSRSHYVIHLNPSSSYFLLLICFCSVMYSHIGRVPSLYIEMGAIWIPSPRGHPHIPSPAPSATVLPMRLLFHSGMILISHDTGCLTRTRNAGIRTCNRCRMHTRVPLLIFSGRDVLIISPSHRVINISMPMDPDRTPAIHPEIQYLYIHSVSQSSVVRQIANTSMGCASYPGGFSQPTIAGWVRTWAPTSKVKDICGKCVEQGRVLKVGAYKYKGPEEY